MADTILEVSDLCRGRRALTAAAGSRLAECASVCLEERGHDENVEMAVHGVETMRRVSLRRLAVTEIMRDCYNDEPEATEEGACGVALLLVQAVTGLTVVRRSRKGTGYDYCLGTESALDFSARLEVSGIRQGSRS